MAYSIVTHPGDGSTTTFPINFTLGFISRDDVKCRVGSEVDGLDQPIYRALTWITDGLVQVGGAPAALGVNLEFTRTVDKDELIHDYSDGAAITESNLDDSNKQVIMLVHEFLDGRAQVIPNASQDLNSQRIINLADGIDAQDAVTVAQAAQAIALTPVAVQAAEDAADALVAAEAAAVSATSVLANSMLKSQNLNDVADKPTSRTNLDVYSKSEVNTTVSGKVSTAGDTMTGNLNVPSLNGGQLAGLRNKLINGEMRINQRYVNNVVTPTFAGQYTLDRWNAQLSVTSKFSVQRVVGSPLHGIPYALSVVSLSAYALASSDFFGIMQRVEGVNLTDLAWGTANAKTVTLSFLVKTSIAGLHGGAIFNESGHRCYPFSYTVNTANTWEYKTVTIPGDTTGTWDTANSTGLRLNFGLGCGATASGTAGTWGDTLYRSATGAVSIVSTNAATFQLSAVQLETGDIATPFERVPYGYEYAQCQRYYQKSNPDSALPSSTAYYGVTGHAVSTAAAFGYGSVFAVSMRANPTVIIYSPTTGASGYIRDISGNADKAVSTVTSSAERISHLSMGASLTSTNLHSYNYAAEAEL